MAKWSLAPAAALSISLATTGCMPGLGLPDQNAQDVTGVVAGVAVKAEQVAHQIGGGDGFGGVRLTGYAQHMGPMMGFVSMADLADADGEIRVRFHNESDQECTFHVVYTASHMGLGNETLDVTVGPGASLSVEIPCAEILGLGSLTEVGEVACELADGRTFDNRMCVPGFMNTDYPCGGEFECYFGVDVNDLDNDGDTGELIATTEALHEHLGPIGMMGDGHMGGR